jgi:SAM-dependent methyltransferase
LAALLTQRAECRDVIITDQSRVYFPGEYQAGECPPYVRFWDQEPALRDVLRRFETTHHLVPSSLDHGYIVLLPSTTGGAAQAGMDLKRYLNILPNDQPDSLNLILGIAGATGISMQRRMFDSRFATRYLVGHGIDIGGGADSLALYSELFPQIANVFVYDEPHGDAQYLENVPDDVFDFAYSSHCLEHVRDPMIALQNWIRVVRPGGYLVISAPDEDLYEQGVWPSTFNADHKTTFTIHKPKSWSPVSVNVLDLVRSTSHLARPISIMTIDHAFRFELQRFDQTCTPLAECSIEFVLRKL